MRDLVCAVLLTTGVGFMALAAVGLVRLPDILLRISAAGKASTLGTLCTLLAMALYFGDGPTVTRALAIFFFVVLTVPVAAHMLGRAAYFCNNPLWETRVDELRGRAPDIGCPGRNRPEANAPPPEEEKDGAP